jgi:hypothetical protein
MVLWLFFVMLNYWVINKFCDARPFPLILWSINLLTLYINEVYHGINFLDFTPSFLEFIFKPLQESRNDALVPWHSIFNMTILRMISFGMDKYWAIMKKNQISFETHLHRCTDCKEDV